MVDVGRVQGSGEQAKELIVGVDTVYVHTNITKVEKDKEGNLVEDLYEYNEIQYTKDEYIKLQAQQITECQLAIIEIAESLEV